MKDLTELPSAASFLAKTWDKIWFGAFSSTKMALLKLRRQCVLLDTNGKTGLEKFNGVAVCCKVSGENLEENMVWGFFVNENGIIEIAATMRFVRYEWKDRT